MRKVIDAVRYDTEKATLVHAWDNDHYLTDFGYRAKTLYRTANGRWFLHHEGGPMSDMARRIGNNNVSGGENIEPVSEDDAYRFLGEDAIDQHFADRVKDA